MNEERNIMTLTDENGNNVDYELLDIIEYDKRIYAVFYPTIPDDTEVVILRVENADNADQSVYVVEQDEFIINKVYEMFKEKYNDDFKFI